VRVVPPDNHLGPARLLEHVEHFGLEDGVDGLNADARAVLWHREYVRTRDLCSGNRRGKGEKRREWDKRDEKEEREREREKERERSETNEIHGQ
jgi:hypothetical protein